MSSARACACKAVSTAFQSPDWGWSPSRGEPNSPAAIPDAGAVQIAGDDRKRSAGACILRSHDDRVSWASLVGAVGAVGVIVLTVTVPSRSTEPFPLPQGESEELVSLHHRRLPAELTGVAGTMEAIFGANDIPPFP